MTRDRSPARSIAVALPLVCALALNLGGLGLGGAEAQESDDSGIEVRATPALGGKYRRGRWVEIQVDVSNSGTDRTVEVIARGDYGQPDVVVPLELPGQSSKSLPIRIWRESESEVLIEVEQDGLVLANHGVYLDVSEEAVVVIVGADATAMADLDAFASPGGSGRVTTAHTTAADLPRETLALGSAEVMVAAAGDFANLDTDQLDAVRKWVALGGLLILNGGPDAAGAGYGSIPEAIRPASVMNGVVDLPTFDGLVEFLHDAPEGSAPIAKLEPAVGASVVASAVSESVLGDGVVDVPGQALIVARPYGYGSVVALAFDVTAEPFAEWGGLDKLWRGVSIDGRNSLWLAGPTVGLPMSSELTWMERIGLPRVRTLAGFLGAFVIAVGPANYVWLRRRRRLELAWVTIPVLTVAASVLAYGAGTALHGRSLRVHRISSVEVVGNTGVAYASTLVGVFSPATRRYDVATGSALIHSEFTVGGRNQSSGGRKFEITQGAANGIRALEAAQWAFTSFTTEAVIDWPAPAEPADSSRSAELEEFWANPLGADATNAVVIPSRAGEALPLSDVAANVLAGDGGDLAGFQSAAAVSVPADVPPEGIALHRALLAAALQGPTDADGRDGGMVYPPGIYPPGVEYMEFPEGIPPRSLTVTPKQGRAVIMGWLTDAPYPIKVGSTESGPDDVTLVFRRLASVR